MANRSSSSKENDVTPSKRPFHHTVDKDDKPGIIELDNDPANLIKDIKTILEYQKKAIPHLYPNKKRNGRSEILNLIQESLIALDERLQEAMKVKVSIATFGALGKGKSFVLNHVLKHNLDIEDLCLLPSGHGDSKTPVPVKIKEGSKVEVTAITANERSKTLFSKDLTDSSLKEAAECIKDMFRQIDGSYKDLERVDLVAPLPVFKYFKEMVKAKCTYKDIEVEIEFVDLPGRGDNHGNALIGKELNHSDVMLVFKNSGADRPVKIDDLKEVFQRRKIFEYVNRPKFVIIANQENPDCPIDEESAKDKRKDEEEQLYEEWRKLQELQESHEEEIHECYKVVYERLPLTTAKEFLEKFQEESKALIFSPKLNEQFLSDLGEVIIEHVNEVILKKNIHPVMQLINKDANTRKKRITSLIRKEKKANQARKFKPLKNVVFQVCLEDEEFFYNFKDDISTLNLHALPDMVQAHYDLINLVFKQDEIIQQLLCKLTSSLEEHFETLLKMSERDNGLLVSDQMLSNFAHMNCERKANDFMKQHARSLISNCLEKLEENKPSRKVKKQWTEFHDDEEHRKNLLEDHFNLLVQQLSKGLVKRSRSDQGLVKMLDDFRTTIDKMIILGLENDRCVIVSSDDVETLKKIKQTNGKFSKFSLKKIQEVNPHLEHKKDFLDSKSLFPDPPMTSSEHAANVLPPINHDNSLKKVFDLLKKQKSDALDELRIKLGLSKGSLAVPQSSDELEWTRILLNVLQNDIDFHHAGLEPSLPVSCRVDLTKLAPDKYIKAKQQLFAYQKSAVECDIKRDDSIPNDTIRIKITEGKDGLTALVSAALHDELMKLGSLSDPMTQLAPVFMPSIHYGPDSEALGNVYLEEDPWTSKEEEDDDNNVDDTVAQEPNTVQEQTTGLEDLPVNIFCVVEPDDEDKFRSTLSEKPPNSNISFRYVVLPQNGRGIGVSRSIIKLLAEGLKLPQYWTVDDDIKLIREYNKNSGYWKRCTMGRALLYGQRVYQDCTKRVVNDISETERYEHAGDLYEVFPDWAKRSKTKTVTVAQRLLYDSKSHDDVKNNIFCLNDQFSDEMIEEDCKGDRVKYGELRAAIEEYIEKFKKCLLSKNYKRIGRVSIGHESGKRYGYYSRKDEHYRKSMQNYQMVLHNPEASKGFNYVTDEVVLRHEEGTVHQPHLRDVRYLGLKWEDKSFCKALEFYGIIGYQVITVALANQKLRNAFGRIGNSYQLEPPQCDDDDAMTHTDEE